MPTVKPGSQLEADLIALAESQGIDTRSKLSQIAQDEPEAPKQPKGPNKLEAAYMSHLEARKDFDDIKAWLYESIKLKIGVKRCWYTPDFWVLAADGVHEFHETKGPHCWDDARVKLQSAARQYPHFRFFLCRKEKGRWLIERV